MTDEFQTLRDNFRAQIELIERHRAEVNDAAEAAAIAAARYRHIQQQGHKLAEDLEAHRRAFNDALAALLGVAEPISPHEVRFINGVEGHERGMRWARELGYIKDES